MSDLISRSALIEAMEKKYEVAEKKGLYAVGLDCGFIITEQIIKEQPTVEAVPRCYIQKAIDNIGCIARSTKNADFINGCNASLIELDRILKPTPELEVVIPTKKMMELIQKWSEELGLNQDKKEEYFFGKKVDE